MRDPLVTLTLVGLAGLFILNPSLLASGLNLITGLLTRGLAVAAGGAPAGG